MGAHTLHLRLAALSGGLPAASAVPARGSPEYRQLVRWAAQIVLTEALCRAEAAERGLRTDVASGRGLDQRAAVACGSIYAAAYDGSAAVRAADPAVPAHWTVHDPDLRRY